MAKAPPSSVAAPLPAPGARRRRVLALLVALAYLVPALASLGDYGPTYDAIKGDYPYGERLLGYLETGDEHFLELRAYEPRPEVRAPHPDFELERYATHWIFPVGSLLSALSCRLLWTELGLLPAMSAHHLPFVLLAAGLVFVVASFGAARFGALGGIVAGGALFLTPSFFGHSFNNPKDLPECCFYTGAVLLGFHAFESGRARTWLAAGALTGLALATKLNALFLPVQLVLYLAVGELLARARAERGPRLSLPSLGAATFGFVLVYYAVSPPFWSAPIEGPRRWIAQMLAGGNDAFLADGVARPVQVSWEAPRAVLHTTPLGLLALALVGLVRPGLAPRLRAFLGLSLALPIARNLLPGMRNFDLTRHFLEFLPMLALLAGAGAAWLAERLRVLVAARVPRAEAVAAPLVGLLALAPPAWAVHATHPNQVVYFNALAGGLGGRQARGDPEALDFWGNSVWQGLDWIRTHPVPGANVLVPYKDFIARCGAPARLGPGQRILDLGEVGADSLPLFVMHLVNWDASLFVTELERRAPEHAILVQGGALLQVHLLQRDEHGAQLLAALDEYKDARRLERALLRLLRRRPDLGPFLGELHREKLAPELVLERLRPVLSAEDQARLVQDLERSPRIDRR